MKFKGGDQNVMMHPHPHPHPPLRIQGHYDEAWHGQSHARQEILVLRVFQTHGARVGVDDTMVFTVTRAWCLFEIFTSVDTQSRLEIDLTPTQRADLVDALRTDHASFFMMLAT